MPGPENGASAPAPVATEAPRPAPAAGAPEGNGGAPTVDAGKSVVEDVIANPDTAVQQPGATENLADGTNLNQLAEGLKNDKVDPDAELKKLAGPDAAQHFGQAPTENAGGLPTEPNTTEQPANPQQTPDATSEGHDLDSQQARLDEMTKKTPEELQKLATEGNPLAKKVLSDMEKQTSAGAEAYAQQQAPQAPEADAQTPPAAEQQPEPPPPAAPEQQTPESTPPPPAPEAQTETTQTTSEAATAEQGNENQEANAESEDAKTEAALKLHDVLKRLEKFDPKFDANSEAGKALAKDLVNNPEAADKVMSMMDTAEKQAKETAAELEANGIKIDVQELTAAMTGNITEQYIRQLDDENTKDAADPAKTEDVKKRNILLRILKALAVATLQVVGSVMVGTGQGLKDASEKMSQSS
jgi:hypothetical protein